MTHRCWLVRFLTVIGALALVSVGVSSVAAQDPMQSLREPHIGGSRNMHVLAHIPLGAWSTVMDIEMEQELSRPYVYVARADWRRGAYADSKVPSTKGVDIIDIKDPTNAKVIYSWRIEQGDLHQGTGGMDNKYFKLNRRYYDIQSTQFRSGGPNTDMGAVVLDVTSLPDISGVKEVGRLKAPDAPGGFHNIFMYKHSDGRAILFTTAGNPGARMYDMERFLSGAGDQGMIGRVPVPEGPVSPRQPGYHDMYVGYDPATRQDKFYGGGTGGYHVYDVTNTENIKLVTSVTGVAGVRGGHTMTPTSDGRYLVTETEYQYTPLRLFDLKPGLDGEVKTISRPVGAWLNSWDGNPHNHEVRWPYVFVSGYMDGIQVFNMMDPTNPYTVGYYYICDCTLPAGADGAGQRGGMNGTFGVDVRNADGLVVASDRNSGFWALKMDGFDGWNGNQWGVPNISSVQDWDNGPEGARATRVSTK